MNERDRIHCEEVIAHLLDYLDGEMDAVRRAEVDRHLQDCRGCYSRAEFEKALRDKIGQLGQEKAPASLQRRLKALIDAL